MTPGLALFDADGDEDLDLYLVNAGPIPGSAGAGTVRNRLYLNRGDGTFVDATETSGAGDRAYGMGCAVGDYDGDGDLDLYVLNYGPNVLYRNQGEGRFEAVEVGVADAGWSVGAAFIDYDLDGDLDLYVVNYLLYDVNREQPCTAGTLRIYCSPEQFAPAPDRLYRNQLGHFSEVSRQAGIVAGGRGMGIAVGDLDDDGDPDLYITNDRSQNFLYINAGGRFAEMGAEAGVGYGMTGQIEGGMASVVADFTGTGKAAIFHTNFQKEPNRLFVEAGGGFFDDLTFRSGLGFPSREKVSWGMAVLDVEGDGDIDLAVGNGHVYDNADQFIAGSSYTMPDHLFFNDGTGRFEAQEFPGPPLSSRGLASGDLDGDGDPDLVIASCADRLRVWRNDGGRRDRFLLLELKALSPNTHAYGARVVAEIGSRHLRRDVAGGGGYASHSDSRLYFGLGDATVVDRLQVRWPDGSLEAASGIRGGQRARWRQGEGIVVRRSL
jgi:hypothetical protein